MRIVCLVSGSGSNLQSIINAERTDELGSANVVGVISNNPDAFGLKRAAKANIPTRVLSHNDYSSRRAFDFALIEVLDEFCPDLIVLAGFMRILSEPFVNYYKGRLVNIHPSLLPKYRGLNTHQQAIDAGDSTAGASVHWVTSEVDQGEIIGQITVPIIPGDTADTLKVRVLNAEHSLYPSVIKNLAENSKIL